MNPGTQAKVSITRRNHCAPTPNVRAKSRPAEGRCKPRKPGACRPGWPASPAQPPDPAAAPGSAASARRTLSCWRAPARSAPARERARPRPRAPGARTAARRLDHGLCAHRQRSQHGSARAAPLDPERGRTGARRPRARLRPRLPIRDPVAKRRCCLGTQPLGRPGPGNRRKR